MNIASKPLFPYPYSTMSHLIRAVAVCLFAILALAGCGGASLASDDGLGLADPSVTVAREETGQMEVLLHLTRDEKPGLVTQLSVTGLPDGVTANFSAASVTLNDYTIKRSQLMLTTDRAMPAGEYVITVHRKGGNREHTQRFTLKVVDFAVGVSVSDSDVTIAPGETKDITVTLTRRGNSSGTVELTLTGDTPDGVSWTLTPGRVIIDPNNPSVKVRLRLEADTGDNTDHSTTCRVQALKGIYSYRSKQITVRMDAPDPPPDPEE